MMKNRKLWFWRNERTEKADKLRTLAEGHDKIEPNIGAYKNIRNINILTH